MLKEQPPRARGESRLFFSFSLCITTSHPLTAAVPGALGVKAAAGLLALGIGLLLVVSFAKNGNAPVLTMLQWPATQDWLGKAAIGGPMQNGPESEDSITDGAFAENHFIARRGGFPVSYLSPRGSCNLCVLHTRSVSAAQLELVPTRLTTFLFLGP